jgi:hypothetical protein
MRYGITTFAVACAMVVALGGAGSVGAIEQGSYRLEVLVDGRPLPEYAARGIAYIEALRGKEFALRLTNRTGERIAVALSVDGLNTIDARRTTATAARKWVLAPWQTVTIAGWQTGLATARSFFFTSEESSYGAWLGQRSNLGVIAAAVFRELQPAPILRSQERDIPASPAPAPRRESSDAGAGKGESSAQAEHKARAREDLAATGIGRRMEHQVQMVNLTLEETPAAQIEMRYEYREALVRLGVLPRPAPEDRRIAQRERARGFEDPEFCPEPKGRRD